MRFLGFVTVFLFLAGTNLSYADNVNFNELSNCREWEETRWHYEGIAFEYKGETVYLADKHYGCYDDNSGYHFVEVFYRPVVEKELVSLKSYPDFENKSLRLAESRGQWFLLYVFTPADKTKEQSFTYLYERTRTWHEFYRAWQPKWRFVIDWENEFKTGTEEDDFMSKKFGLVSVH